MSDPALPFALLAIGLAVAALWVRTPAPQSDRKESPSWVWRLPGLRDMLADTDLVLRLKRAGRPGAARVKQFILARLVGPVAGMTLGLLWLALVPGPARSPLWIAAFLALLAGLGYSLPALWLNHLIRKRQTAIRKTWPDALDLLLLSVEAGLSLDAALAEVANRMQRHAPELTGELRQTLAELSYLTDRQQAFANLAARIDLPIVGIVTSALIQAERYGTPIAEALRAMARDTRLSRMAEAERRATSLPPRLTVPMVVFFLPVLFAVIFTPGIILFLQDF